jgi:hypothetical protein
MHRHLEKILRSIKGFGTVSGTDLHLLIVREAGLDNRTIEKYVNFLKETRVIRKGKGQEWLVDSRKIDELLTGGSADNDTVNGE